MLGYFHRVLYFLACFSLSTAQSYCVNATYFYVSSNGTNSRKCLTSGNPSHPCSTLTYLTENMDTGWFPHKHITRCFGIVILSDLTLNNSVVRLKSMNSARIVGASNITDPVTIHCEGNSGMILDSVTNFTLYHLQFRGCSFYIIKYRKFVSDYDLPSYLTTIWFNNSYDVYILECSFENLRGSSILLENAYNVTVAKSNFTGNSSLSDNTRSSGGGIIVRLSKDPSVLHHLVHVRVNIHSCSFISTCTFRANDSSSKMKMWQGSCQYGGAININSIIAKSPLEVYVKKCKFIGNVASFGGAISFFVSSLNHNVFLILYSQFYYNKAHNKGGAVWISRDKPGHGYLQVELRHCHFIQNSAYWGGAVAVTVTRRCIVCSNHTIITFTNTSFVFNTASTSGFAIAMSGPDIVRIYHALLQAFFFGNTLIANNHGSASGAMIFENSVLVFHSGSVSTISNNTGTAMVLLNSRAFFNGTILFSNNSGAMGAAIYIKGDSFITFGHRSSSSFIDNRASLYGGAIYSRVTYSCTFHLDHQTTAKVIFHYNYANLLEQSIYIEKSYSCKNTEFNSTFKFLPRVATQVLFSLNTLDMAFEPVVKKVMLGERFVLKPTKMLDKFKHLSVGIGYIRFQIKTQKRSQKNTFNLRGPSTISLDNYTGNLEFFVVGRNVIGNQQAEIDIYYQKEVSTYEVDVCKITFELVPCRIGYKYSPNKKVCNCEAQSSANLFRCDPHGQMLCVRRYYWYSTDFHITYPCPAQNCEFQHGRCPKKSKECSDFTDYCGIKEEDNLCRDRRSGFLCSECASNNSFTFSGVQCSSSSSCHPWRTFVLLLALVVYWILFIVVLLIGLSLNLGVGSGFMFGIVYFFSVVNIYIGSSDLYSIAWIRILLYIDMAIALCDPELLGYMSSTCFVKTWTNPLPHELFRYATPLFVIFIIVFLILFSRYCRVPKLVSLAENSPIHAMCLLILLCYTSISYTSLKLLVPMRVNDSLRVQVAPTVSYFSREHIPYAVVGICAELFFCLPICVLFLFAPLISRRVNLVKLRLKPIVDEFQACYKPGHRWFAGFYFLSRQIVYLVSLTYLGPFPQFNYILTTVNILIFLVHVFNQPYSQKWLNILDSILLVDIIILSQLSPVKKKSYIEATSTINEFFYNVLIPYALILFPSIYLFIALGVLFVKKFYSICFRFSVCATLRESRLGMLLQPIWFKLNTISNLRSTSLRSPISGSSLGDPLLEDLERERSNLTTSLYGST